MKVLSSQLVRPRTVIEVIDAGDEVDIVLSRTQTRVSLTLAQAKRLADALYKFVGSKERGDE